MTQRVAIVQRIVPSYRTAVLKSVAQKLSASGIALTVFAGTARADEGFEDGLQELACATRVKNRYLFGNAYWQSVFSTLRGYDLVIVEQANAALLNYPLLLSRYVTLRPRRIAYWGHGANLNQKGNYLLNRMKRGLTGAVDHWFAYTQMSADLVSATGFPRNRITVLNNSMDVSPVQEMAAEAVRIGREALRASLGLDGGFFAVFCARLTPGKRLGFLLEAAEIVHRTHPEFRLIIIGDGSERELVENFAASRSWITFTGTLYGDEKARYLAASDVMVLPSWVGLSILDGFAAGLPVIAADMGNHSPEISYLDDGRNGFLTPPTPEAYAAALSALCADPSMLRAMSESASAAAERYSISAMVNNFTSGIRAALPAPQRR